MAADQRVTAAREFLEGARKRKVAELPPSVLMREDAELRRQLGQVLNVIAEAAGVLSQVFADAIEYRMPGSCEECDVRPEGLCNDHAADLDLTDAYIALARELGIEIAQ